MTHTCKLRSLNVRREGKSHHAEAGNANKYVRILRLLRVEQLDKTAHLAAVKTLSVYKLPR